MESVNRSTCGIWDLLPDEVVSEIAGKVAETSPAPLDDLCSMRACSSSTKRVCSILAVAKRVNL